mmetsp:Transcript_28256/g.74111  ORF Transcript_28256/g.74111 Transcript_28256/m.74111 type:complete len:308 (+) Transcript_28256:3-926(+)
MSNSPFLEVTPMATLAAMLAGTAAAAAVRDGPMPVNPVTLEVYHVNQANYTGIENMNTADAAGDAFFDLRTLCQYYECNINKTSRVYPGQCSNPEVNSDNLVITKVEVLAAGFSEYGECNVCVNGTVPITRPPQPCVDGSYHCRCSGMFGRDAPCKPQMGRTSVRELIGGFAKYMNLNQSGPSIHWMVNLANRVGGEWYSTVTAGDCDSPDRTSCDWKLSKTIKEVNATCHANEVQSQIEKLGASCFEKCPGRTADVHTACYITCYYETLLGPDASTSSNSTGGLPADDIVKLWTDAFDTCPPYTRE